MASDDNVQSSADSATCLNSVLRSSLSIITQFFFHSSMLKAWGVTELGSRYHDEWFDKMRRSDTVLDRILELGSRPSSRDRSVLRVGHDVLGILRSDLALEAELVTDLREARARCESVDDPKTFKLLTGILSAEQKFTHWLRAQLAEFEREGAGLDAPGRMVRSGQSRAHDKIVAALNEVLKVELSAVTQVYYHSRMFETWEIKKLHEFHAAETLEKTYRSVAMLRRVLALDGIPAPEGHGKLTIGAEVPEMLHRDFEVQKLLIPLLRSVLDCCDSHGDRETRDLLAGILGWEQKHVDWLKTQFDQIKQHGVEGYIQSQV